VGIVVTGSSKATQLTIINNITVQFTINSKRLDNFDQNFLAPTFF
jgi:hypothetical protein